jgi:hypothetical protein
MALIDIIRKREALAAAKSGVYSIQTSRVGDVVSIPPEFESESKTARVIGIYLSEDPESCFLDLVTPTEEGVLQVFPSHVSLLSLVSRNGVSVE